MRAHKSISARKSMHAPTCVHEFLVSYIECATVLECARIQV